MTIKKYKGAHLLGFKTKAMYEVLKRGRIHNLSVESQLQLLDKIV
jgi:hypothetical protein